jgi:uncharacterized protein YprB with RNaseH-like and TPR domain
MESLNDKLKALGVNLGMGHLTPPRTEIPDSASSNYFPIEKVVNGQELSTPYGNAFLITQTYPRDFQANLDLYRPEIISSNLLAESIDPIKPEPEFIFLDTETSGLSGGSGTFAFLIGLGFFEEDHFKLYQLFMRHPEEEQGVIAALNSLLGTSNTLVTFNGKSFDVPLLNTRHKLHGFSPIFLRDTHAHIDMLTVARRIWKNRLPSRSLGDLEKQILNVFRTDEEVPGYMIPDIYFDYLATGDARPISNVIYHNAMDIVSLANLFTYTNQILLNPLSHPVDSIDLASIARIFENNKNIDQALELYKVALNQGLPIEIYIQTVLRYANIYKQEKAWEKAVILWEKASEAGSLDASIELAKYYEHQVRDVSKAIFWTQQSINHNLHDPGNSWAAKQVEKDLNHRLLRLENKARP